MNQSKKLLGISCGALSTQYGDIRALEICAEAGFDSVDFDLLTNPYTNDPSEKTDEEMIEYCQSLKKRANELGIIIGQTHGLCSTFNPNDDEYNAYVIEASRRHLLATASLGAPACVIHSISTHNWQDATPETMRRVNLEMFGKLIPFAEEYGVNIALETFGDVRKGGRRIDFFGNVEELKNQYELLNTKNKVLCMDTGHTHKAHDIEPSVLDTVDAIRYLGKDIKLLHLNDNNGYSDQHLPPFLAGDSLQLKWKNVMSALDEIEYDGIYNFELTMGKMGSAIEDYTHFLGKYLRRFIDGTL